MNTQGKCRALLGYLLILILTVFAAGCGGGGGSGQEPSGGITPTAESLTIQAGPVPITAVVAGNLAELDGSSSQSSTGAPLSYAWAFTAKPVGSKAVLQDVTTASPSFVADAVGTYLVELVVTDNNGASARDVAVVLVRETEGEDPDGPKWNHPGLSSYCVNCHDGNYVYDAEGNVARSKSGDHLATSNMCQACHTSHTTIGFEIPVYFDHHEIFDPCSNCHNGVLAIGKSQFHEPTSAECDECHNTNKFVELPLRADGSYDHTGIEEPCSACHNSIVAKGKADKKDGHVETEKECGLCHTTIDFTSAYVDHSNITQPCTDCHGNGATGPIDGHPDTSAVDCVLCHDPISQTFSLNGVYDHSKVDPSVLPCQTCHNDTNSINAPGKGSAPTPHVQTSADCGNCHNIDAFKPAFAGNFDHSTIQDGTRCDSSGCHDGTALGMPTDGTHLTPINNDDCAVCHLSPGGTFATGIFVHTDAYLTTYQCMDCHDNMIATGKTLSHVDTTDDCGTCHVDSIDPNTKLGTTFKGALINHSTFDSDCAVCHNGDTAIAQPATHMPTPTGVDCSACHSTGNKAVPEPFAPAKNFAHQAETTTLGCNTCHNGEYMFTNDQANKQVVTSKPVNHIPAIDDCSVCHDDTTIPGGFASANGFVNNIHPPITRGCEGCHNGKFPPAPGKADTTPAHTPHVPTDQDCYLCHNNTDFSVSLFNHTGISGNCESCHNGGYEASANALGKSADHITTTSDCLACHSSTGTDFTGGYVDHTGPDVVGKRCDSCHVDGSPTVTGKDDTPQGVTHITTTDDCVVCHTPGGSFANVVFDHSTITADTECKSCHGPNGTATGMSADHPPTESTQDCRNCHNTTAFAGAKYDHSNITGDCVTCHNGDPVIGKKVNHVPTNLDCAVCHVTAGFKPAIFGHTAKQIGNTQCKNCHNGTFAIGQSDTHVATAVNSDCGDCHSTDTWAGAGFDHSGVTNNCANLGCHDGSVSTTKSKPTGHLDTSLDCVLCHQIGGSFVTDQWDHRNNTNECKSCHEPANTNNKYNIAPRKPKDHFVTTQDCLECHKTSAWVPTANFTHTTNNYPGDHSTRKVPSCYTCHTTHNESIPFSTNSNATPYYPPQANTVYCAACHYKDYDPRDAGRHSTLSNDKDCGDCHRVSSSSW
ncbi:MAG: hypothetical protein PVJ72_02835 [Gammaproteobacteria bacterium]|jgi:hypothetical protein